MSRPAFRRSPSTPRRRVNLNRGIALAALLIGVVAQDFGKAADAPPDALPYSLSYTVTGDYAVGGVDLLPSPHTDGFQTATLHMGTTEDNTVPANAEILAAFLYWETLADSEDQLAGVKFRGTPVTFVRTVSQGLDGVFAPCWSPAATRCIRCAPTCSRCCRRSSTTRGTRPAVA